MANLEHKRIVIHFDIDCFYAQVEMIRNPDLRDKPLGIQQKYLLVTCNYEARKRGVTKLMSIAEAKKKCSDLVIVNGEDLTHYRNMSYQISDFIQKYTPVVERLGFDENYADITEMVEDRIRNRHFEHKFSGKVYDQESDKDAEGYPTCDCGCLLRIQVGSQIASDIREGLKHELGISCCAGIAHNKLLAKLVGSIHKPNQQTSILPHLGYQFVSSLPGIRSIPGIGHSSEKRLQARGISSIWDLQQTPSSILKAEFGRVIAETFSKLCFGIDDSPVIPLSLPQTLSDEDSFKCCNSLEDAKSHIHRLTTSLLQRLRNDKRTPHTLRLTIRRINSMRYSRQCPIPPSVFAGFQETDVYEKTISHLMSMLTNLFHKLVDSSQSFHLTLINVCFSKLVSPNSKQNTIDSFFSGKSSKVNLESRSEDCTHVSSQKFRNHESITCNPSSPIVTTTTTDVMNGKEPQLDIESDADPEKTEMEMKPSTGHDDFGDENKTLKLYSSPSCSSSTNEVVTAEDVIMSQPGNICQTLVISETERVTSTSTTVSPSNPKVHDDSLQKLQKLLPKHINAYEVFQLPDDVQDEVLLGFGINMTNTINGERIYTHINKVSTRSRRHSEISSGKRMSLITSRQPLFNPKNKKKMTNNQDTSRNVCARKTDENVTIQKSDLLFSSEINQCCEKDISNVQNTCKTVTTDYSLIEEQKHTSADYGEIESLGVNCEVTDINDGVLRTEKERHSLGVCEKELMTYSSHNELEDVDPVCTENDVPKQSNTQQPNLSRTGSVITSSPECLSNCRKRKCPEGVDVNVFFSLPRNIQGEIMAHNAMGTTNLFLKNQTQPAQRPSANNDTRTKSKNKSDQKDLFNYFKKSKTK